MNKQILFIIIAALFGTNVCANKLREQLDEAYELECKQRAYDLMLELEVPLQEAQRIIKEASTPPDYRYYEHFYQKESVDFADREPVIVEQSSDEGLGFPAHITDQALDLVAQFKKLKITYLVVINKEKVFTVEYVDRLINAFIALKHELLVDADVRRAVTIRIVPLLIRVLKGKDVISYIDEYIENLNKVLC